MEPWVAVKWFVPEEHSAAASRLLDGGHDLVAPENLPSEVGRVLTVKARMRQVSMDECVQILAALRGVPLRLEGLGDILEAGLEVAVALDRPLADGLGLAMAVRQDCRLVTAQAGLREAAASSSFARRIKWVADLR